MDFKTITLTRENKTAVLTLNRPEAMNALNEQMIEEMGWAVEQIAEDLEVRVLIITGGEKVFAAGGDIKAMMDCDPLAARDYVAPIHMVFNRIAGLPKPTIAAVCGHALGGGAELMATCDFRIAGEKAQFGFPEITLGIFPAAGGSQRIPRLIGLARAKELMFTGDIIGASTAQDIGLVNKVVPTERVMEEALKLAGKLASRAPLALSYLKKSMHSGLDIDLGSGLAQELDKFTLLFATIDQKEGMKAFIEKRKPIFLGK
ncbi:MAG TPA: enoyl-CoA hydratase-related protein [Syntrophomonadaceae bacterium]|nr:enoyl-CoA hydratase-related protein [Syntrophomonadaceae bacterium]